MVIYLGYGIKAVELQKKIHIRNSPCLKLVETGKWGKGKENKEEKCEKLERKFYYS